MIQFGQFGPDRSLFDPNFCDTIENVFPAGASFTPFPSFSALSSALAARPQGAFLADSGTGTWVMFVGTATKLYKLNTATLGWDDISRTVGGAYTIGTDDNWAFRQFGTKVFAANGVDVQQVYNLASPSTFENTAGSPPRSKYLETLGDFLVALNLTTDTRSIHWSGLNDPTFWTPRQRSSDFQAFPDDGDIQGSAAGPNGIVIFHEHCIREGALALDTPLVMTFKKTVEGHGVLAPRSIVSTGSGAFYLSQDGFYRYGTPPVAIGVDRVDRFFFGDALLSEIFNIHGIEDPERKIVYWAYASKSNAVAHSFDKVLAYHYGIDRWSSMRPGTNLSEIISATTPGYTLDTLDSLGLTLDTLPFSLDSRAWSGSLPSLAGFSSDYKLGLFSGAPLQATLQTAESELSPGRRTFVNGFRVLTDAPLVTGRVAVRDYAGQTRTWKAAAANSTRTGLVPARASGRMHRFEVVIPAAATWNHVHGVDPDGSPEGQQ